MPTTIRRGARAGNIAGPPAPTGIDLIVTDIAWTGTPAPGDQVVFRATVQNVGDTATPAGTILDVAFYINFGTVSWSDTYTTSLAPGNSVVLTATGGPSSVNYWTATAGSFTVRAFVNSVGRITESNTTNNTLDEALTVGTVPDPPADIASGVGCWRMIDWGAAYEAFTDIATWKGRGFGGFAVGYDYLAGYGSNTDFTASSQLGNTNAVYTLQRWLENVTGSSFAQVNHANGCEAYLGQHWWDNTAAGTVPAWGDWFNTTKRADVATKMGRVAAFCQWLGIDGLKSDTEHFGWGGGSELAYAGNPNTAQQTLDQAYTWGFEISKAVHQAMPGCKMLTYNWHPPGGWEDTFIYGVVSSAYAVTYFWLGWLEAMATYGNTGSRLIVVDPFFYKPTAQVSGALLANALKYHTQGSIAWLSRNVTQSVWNTVCDRVDISTFSWPGTDSNNSTFYKHTGENSSVYDMGFAAQLALFRRYSMGTRRANYSWEGSPSRYTWLSATVTDPTRSGSNDGNQANNWYVVSPSDPPGGHVPGMQAAASAAVFDTNAPTVTANTAVNNGNGTYTITGTAQHLDGIRCVRGFVYPTSAARVGGRMTVNARGGTYQTNYDAMTQDYTLTVTGSAGQDVMVTGVSIHDQEHSLRVPLP